MNKSHEKKKKIQNRLISNMMIFFFTDISKRTQNKLKILHDFR